MMMPVNYVWYAVDFANVAVDIDAIMAKLFSSLPQLRRVDHGIVTALLQRCRQISDNNLGAAATGKYSVGDENIQTLTPLRTYMPQLLQYVTSTCRRDRSPAAHLSITELSRSEAATENSSLESQ